MSAEEPMTPEEIAAQFAVPLDAVKEAIAYCQTNPPEIAKDFEHEEQLMEACGMNDRDYQGGGKFKPMRPQEFARIFDT